MLDSRDLQSYLKNNKSNYTIKENFTDDLKQEYIDSKRSLNFKRSDYSNDARINLLVKHLDSKYLHNKFFSYWKKNGLTAINFMKLVFLKQDRNYKSHYSDLEIRNKSRVVTSVA